MKTPLVLLAIITAGLLSTPGTATAVTCTTTAHTTTAGILATVNGEPGGPPSAGTAVLTTAGVTASLPDATSKVQWLVAPPTATLLVDISNLTYRMQQLVPGSAVLPSYQLAIDPDPADTTAGAPHFATLVYEPGNNAYGYIGTGWKTFDVDEPTQKWWSTRVLPLLPATAIAQNPLPYPEFTHAYPRATVLAYGWNSGKGSAQQRARISQLTFATTKGCVTHRWAKPTTTASPSSSPSQTSSPTPSVSQTSGSATASATTSPSASSSTSNPAAPTSTASTDSPVPAPADDEGNLPTTGAGLTGMLAAGLLMVGIGGFAVWRARRRRSA